MTQALLQVSSPDAVENTVRQESGLEGQCSCALWGMTRQPCGLCWETGWFSLAITAAQPFFLRLCFPQFLSPAQMAEVADGRGRVRLSGTAAASHRARCAPERLSGLRQYLFGVFGLGFFKQFVRWKNKRQGGVASWQRRLSLRERGKNQGNHISTDFNTGLGIWGLFTELAINPSI